MSSPAELLRLPPLPASVKAGRVPRWPLDRLVHRACPVCAGDRPRRLCRRPDELVVAQCPECGMTYLPDIPAEPDLEAFYRDYGSYKGLGPAASRWWHRLMPFRRPDPFVEILLQTGGLAGQRLCEVGCSYGLFLRRCRDRGADVFGVEWDDHARQHLAGQGMASGRSLPADRHFDIGCAFQLLEHLADPQGFVRDLAARLAPDGRLLLAMPNGGDADRIGPAWVGFRVDLEHLNYFNARTLAALLQPHGLYVEQTWDYMQADLPRADAPGPRRGRFERLFAHASTRLGVGPYHLDGTYILCLLARKAASA